MMPTNNTKPIIFCCRPSIYASVLLRHLLSNEAITISAVVVSTRFKRLKSNVFYDSTSVIRHSGLRYFFYLVMITEIHGLFGGLLGVPSVKQLAKRHSVPVHCTDNINNPKTQDFVQASIQSDKKNLLFSAMFNQKISGDILRLPGLMCVNFHPGLLPKFRGVDPVLAALQQRESHCHIFLHETIEAFDQGNTIVHAQISVESRRSLFWHQYRLFDVGADAVSDWLKNVWAEDIPIDSKPQIGQAGYYSWPTKLELRGIKRLFDWCDLRTLFLNRQ